MTASSSSPLTVLVLVRLTPEPTTLATFEASLPKGSTVIYRPREEPTLPTEEEYASADAIFMFQFPSNLTSITQVPKLKFIQLASAGSNHLDDTDFFKSIPESHPLIIASSSGIHVVPIAEHVIATTMMLYHQLSRFVVATRTEQRWHSHAECGFVIKELRDLTIGVLGYGHIGAEVARMGQAMGMKVIAANRTGKKATIKGFLIPGTGDHNGDIPSAWHSTDSESALHEFYASSDVVVNTLPANAATDKFVGERAFRSMKNDAIYVNIGRGGTTDQEPLITALQAGLDLSTAGAAKEGDLRIGGASLDVTTPEPLGKESPLYTLENVFLTPHMCGMSAKYFVRATEVLSVNLDRVIAKGEGALNAVRGKGE